MPVSESDSSSLNSLEDDKDTDNLLSDVELEGFPKDQHIEEAIHSTPRKYLSYKIRKVLFHGSFFVIGVCILVAGGVSSHYHPHVDPEEYYNCTTFSNSSYFSDITLDS